MTDKAYIVANEQQEQEVLEKLEREGVKWRFKSKPTEWVPTRDSYSKVQFPYVLFNDDDVTWGEISELEDNHEICYDGRKEEKMSEKYLVSQEFMNELEKWNNKLSNIDDGPYISPDDFIDLPVNIMNWRDDSKYTKENNNRLIAIIRWVNGEDVFEIEKPNKWVVRSKEHDEGGHYQYVIAGDFDMSFNEYHIEHATRFDTEEEAQSWANSHQEVVQVEVEE